jgi:hypothetical protein
MAQTTILTRILKLPFADRHLSRMTCRPDSVTGSCKVKTVNLTEMYAFTGGRGEWALIKPGEIGLTPTERAAEGIH